jgi:hypothetical protein
MRRRVQAPKEIPPPEHRDETAEHCDETAEHRGETAEHRDETARAPRREGCDGTARRGNALGGVIRR